MHTAARERERGVYIVTGPPIYGNLRSIMINYFSLKKTPTFFELEGGTTTYPNAQEGCTSKETAPLPYVTSGTG